MPSATKPSKPPLGIFLNFKAYREDSFYFSWVACPFGYVQFFSALVKGRSLLASIKISILIEKELVFSSTTA
ncbi:hypothetical protein DM02DRAFT_74307 [Periconia macrospinosa]|uniref:Uncharacterized protein n=1 Tax=Periconia macrospinosa TaxID=97972 RepID=A0A2V1DIM4_9PLEO|nr:hypothetical protein DM02DRAFT_74307 [Periconia macrospinosa]